ncbi:mechanosensitive ion channel family protein [Salinisphaera sp. Q1T1-3]|uniref:mechanosensitive ion channel family protein n=1 Tax=Salinisphaera sp. Q1T1-3 TaxID=2321229 RepID=UPI000E7722F6|nr:mechanosensitive ion channel family protein [Salinisphaera sp. Q1T1-3]RJS94121.1 mechanosensitive ion channel family protein [Salinisphaera sp. Q1T1-3]
MAAPETQPLFDWDRILSSLWHTIGQAWAEFLTRLPLIGIAVVVLALTWAITWISLRLARLLAGARARPSLVRLVERLLKLIIWALGLLLAAIIVFPGISPANAIGGLGLLSVAVGFAFRDTFENFFAGMLLLWKYPFEAGDFIESGDILGRVERINIRMTELRQTTGELLLVPNGQLFKNPVVVLTDQPERRISIMTGVAYGVDLAAALEVIDTATRDCEQVQRDRPVQVFAHGFGASGMDIEVAWWCGATPLAVRRSRSEVVVAIKAALDAAGMEIPFPYRTLTFAEPLAIAPMRDDSDEHPATSSDSGP